MRLNPNKALDMQELLTAARSATGLADLGDQGCTMALDRLLTALKTEAHLTERGRAQIGRDLLARLIQRLHLQKQRRDETSIADIAIERPVFIVGLPRTGSTFAHRLLSQHSELSGVALWEMLYPTTPPGKTSHDLIRETQIIFQSIFRQFPEFRSIHDIDATVVDECRWLLKREFQDFSEALLEYNVPGYMSELMEADLTQAYLGHRRQLQHILWRQPRSGRLILKNPGYLWHISEIFDVYPDARLIVLHRDPVPSVASACSLRENAQKMTGFVNLGEIGKSISGAAVRGIEKFLRFRETSENNNVILDLNYKDLILDPIAISEKVFDFLNLPTSTETLTALEDFVRLHTQHKKGRHDYTLERYGLDSSILAGYFADYNERFIYDSHSVS